MAGRVDFELLESPVQPLRNMNPVVRVDADHVPVEAGVVNLAEGHAVGNDRRSVFLVSPQLILLGDLAVKPSPIGDRSRMGSGKSF